MKRYTRKKPGFTKSVGRGVAKGLGKLAKDGATGVVRELTSILTLGLFGPRKRRY